MRSKALFVSNILSTIYAGYLIWVFGGAVVAAGGMDYIVYCQQAFGVMFDLVGFSSVSAYVIFAMAILLIVHICTFTVGAIFGWIGCFTKKIGLANFAAALYLIGTICFPVYILFGLPLTIIGFVGAGNQKKISKVVLDA